MNAALRGLADEVHVMRLRAHPFMATEDGLPGYDHLAPDISAGGLAKHALVLDELGSRASAFDPASLTSAERVTLDVIRHTIDAEQVWLQHSGLDFTVGTAMVEGPGSVLTVAERTSAEDWEQRRVACAAYVEEHARLLADGAGQGRLPVAGLVEAVLAQLDDYLAGAPDAVLEPALRGWRATVAGLPTRSDDECGLRHVPGGSASYAALVAMHTTLDLTAEQIHAIGLEQVEVISAQMLDLGAELELATVPEVLMAYLMSGEELEADELRAEALQIIARAELVVDQVCAAPLPGPCEVRPMAEHLARSGAAPHYTPPTVDSRQPGVFWFNALDPSAAAGWGLEALTFHEAVPGHHLQLARTQLLTGLTDLQRHGFLSAHGEGWGLYAEHLADELGLYSGVGPRIGSLGLRLFRASRLVVDTGIHALGWSRQQAVEWFTSVVPVPPAFADAEILRYIALPGQALSYSIGYLELLQLRSAAREALGDRFDLAEFHAKVLDSGSIPLTTLRRVIDEWIAT